MIEKRRPGRFGPGAWHLRVDLRVALGLLGRSSPQTSSHLPGLFNLGGGAPGLHFRARSSTEAQAKQSNQVLMKQFLFISSYNVFFYISSYSLYIFRVFWCRSYIPLRCLSLPWLPSSEDLRWMFVFRAVNGIGLGIVQPLLFSLVADKSSVYGRGKARDLNSTH